MYKWRFILAAMVSIMVFTFTIHAEPTDDLDPNEIFWADSIAPAYDTPEKIFLPVDNSANFVSYTGVKAGTWEVSGGLLKFQLSNTSAVLNWGNVSGTQPRDQVQSMWPEQNHIIIRIKGSSTGTKSLTVEQYKEGTQSYTYPITTEFSGNTWPVDPDEGVTMNQNGGMIFPTPDGFKLTVTGAYQESFEIEWVKLTQDRCQGYLRKEFTLPAGTVWRAIADVSGATEYIWYGWNRIAAELYVNGQKVERNQAEYLYHTNSVDITPYLQPGTNCIGFYCYRVRYKPQAFFQCRIIMADGTETEWKTSLSTDPSLRWTCSPTGPAGWSEPGFDDSAWKGVGEDGGVQDAYGIYYHMRGESDEVAMAAYAGPFDIRNPDPNKRNLFYEEGTEVRFDVYVPEGLKDPAPDPVLKYYVRRPVETGIDAGGLGTLEASGQVSSFTEIDNSLKYSINLGDSLPDGIYTISLELTRSGAAFRTRTREPFMVIANHSPTPIEGASYTEGMSMTLEETIDFTDPADSHAWKEYTIDPYGNSTEVVSPEAPKIVTMSDGSQYREVVGSERSSFFSYRFIPDHQGDFYMFELDYPDDADRLIEVSISHKAEGEWDNSVSGVGAETGRTFYRTYGMKTLRWVCRATHSGPHSVDIVNGEDGLHSAAAALRVYHITGDLPAIRMGLERDFGIHTERTLYSSGIGNNFGLAKSHPNDGTLMHRYILDLQWMKETYDHYTQYLKFAGQNMHIMGAYQYTNRGTPAMLINHTKDSRMPHCYRAFLANVLEINNIDFYLGMEFTQYRGECEMLLNNAQVAQGGDTCWLVNENGQQFTMSDSSVSYVNRQNWLHPDVKKKFNDYMTAWGMQYKQFTHFKGVHNESGPAGHPVGLWAPGYVLGHPYATDYDNALYCSFDDYTFGLFENDTGIDLNSVDPVISPTDPNRFWHRKNKLTNNPAWLAAFYQWRCDKYAQWLGDAITLLQAERADLQFLNDVMIEDNKFFEDWLTSGQTYEEYLHTMAYDFNALHSVPDLWTGRWTISFKESWRFGLQYSQSPYLWLAKLDPRITDAFATDTNRYVFVRSSWDENQCASKDYNVGSISPYLVSGSDWIMRSYRVRVEPQPGGYQCREPIIAALISGDPEAIVFGWTDLAINLGNEQIHRTFTKVFSQLPPEKFSPVLSTGFDTNFVIRKLVKGGETWIYVANPGFWPISGNIMLDENTPVLNLATNGAETLVPSGDQYRLSVALEPYGLAGYKLNSTTVEVASYENSGIPYRELAYLQELIANAIYVKSIVGSGVATEMQPKIIAASDALANGEYAKAFKLLYEIPVILEVNGVDWKGAGYFDQTEVDIPEASQTSYGWAPDADSDADALDWQAEATDLLFVPEKTYILAVQVAFEENQSGDWSLQYQEDYDSDSPGPWTDVAGGNAWEPDPAHEMNLANDAEVQTGWYDNNPPVGYTVDSGEFSNDGTVTDDYLADKSVELWYAVKPAAASVDHNYRFRIVKTDTDFNYSVYPTATFNYPVIMTNYAWANDEPVEPDAIAWETENTEMVGHCSSTYLLSLQIALNDVVGGDWVLQYQEDYDAPTPGPWTNIAADTIWRPYLYSVNISNNDEVETSWYQSSAPAGSYTPAPGEFSSDADGINDSYASDTYVELWFAMYADINTHGHKYRFRVINPGSMIGYDEDHYALIDLPSGGAMVFQEGVDGYNGTMDINLRRWTSPGKEEDPPPNVGQRAYLRQGQSYTDDNSIGQYNACLIYFAGVKEALEALPLGTVVESATLTIYQFSPANSTNAAIEVSPVTDPNGDGMWTESTSSYPDGYDHTDTNAAYRDRDVGWYAPHIIEELGPPQIQGDCGDHGSEVDYSMLLSESGYHNFDVLPIITEWQSTDVYQGFHLATGLHHFDGSNSFYAYFITHEGALGIANNQYVLGGMEQAEWAPKLEITYTIPAIIPKPNEAPTDIDLSAFTVNTQETKLTASDGADYDYFGCSVSLSGEYAIIGAGSDDTGGYNYGSAYIFKRDGTSWLEEDKLTASDGAFGDYFGKSVSISGDYAIAGAMFNDDHGSNSGSAYIFKRTGSTWAQQAKLIPSGSAADDFFGCSVAISGDYAVVGAVGCDGIGGDFGAAYIFKRNDATWTEQAKLVPADGELGDCFGCAVAISGDSVIIGSYRDDDNGNDSGSAYIFTRDETIWKEEAKLTASDGALADWFGKSVSISGDDAVVGSYLKNSGAGSAYVFKRQGFFWSEQAKLIASDSEASDYFSYAVAISGDYVTLGAYGDDNSGPDSGSVYLFKRFGSGWLEVVKITPDDATPNNEFGRAVFISGEYALAGANDEDDCGAAYAYLLQSDLAIPENSPGGTLVGIISGTDPNDDLLSFSMISDPSGNFEIVNDAGLARLIVTSGAAIDFETTPEYIITVRADDGRGETYDEDIIIPVADVDEDPIAVPSFELQGNLEVKLDAVGSFDPEGDTIVEWEWTLDTAVISTAVQFTHNFPGYGYNPAVMPGYPPYEVILRVKNENNVWSEPVSITVDWIPGDIDGSNKVDFADFNLLKKNYNTDFAPADLDGNGIVDFADFTILKSHYSESR
ncbi:MAG: hypothetical protein JXA52_00835 [Planctomycetes bacterium]|nr:hypothetical protein [Planctomycetota bacterium]